MNHHSIALTAAGTMTALVVVDTVVLATTGEPTVVTDDSQGSTTTTVAMSLALGATFASLAAVLVRETSVFETTGRLLRGSRKVAMASLLVLAAGFVVFSPAAVLTDLDSGPVYDGSGLVAMLALTGMTVSALVMGTASLRHNRLGVGGRVLALLVPVALATVALALVAPTLASPVYCTVVVLLGYATIGMGIHADSAETKRVQHEATAA
jgi:hypothetical protein